MHTYKYEYMLLYVSSV